MFLLEIEEFSQKSTKVRREKRMRRYGTGEEVLVPSEGKTVFIALLEDSPIRTGTVRLILLGSSEKFNELLWIFFG